MTYHTYKCGMAYYRAKIEDYEHLRNEVWVKYINSNRFKLITNCRLYRKYLEYTRLIKRYQRFKDEWSKLYKLGI